MKKTLLITFALFLSFNFFAQNIPFDQYGNVKLSDFENYADNQKITVTLTVSTTVKPEVGPGWGLGTIKPINYSGAASYNFICIAASPEGAPNAYEFTIAEFKNLAKVGGEYYIDQYDQKGLTINAYNGATLTSIIVGSAIVPSTSLNFEESTLGDIFSKISWAAGDITSTVENDPAGIHGKSLHVIATNYNAYPKMTVTLPDGKSLADMEKITFNIYFKIFDGETASYPQNKFKKIEYFIGTKGGTFTPNAPTGGVNNLIADEANDTWLSKEISLTDLTDVSLLALNSFDLALGISHNKCNYYLDNITFQAKISTSIGKATTGEMYFSNNTLYLNTPGAVQVYDINGRLHVSKQNVSMVDFSDLVSGVYIVKSIVKGETQVIKIAK